MKKTMSIAAIALMMAGSSALACGACGCADKKADKEKSSCSACEQHETSDAKKADAAKK